MRAAGSDQGRKAGGRPVGKGGSLAVGGRGVCLAVGGICCQIKARPWLILN